MLNEKQATKLMEGITKYLINKRGRDIALIINSEDCIDYLKKNNYVKKTTIEEAKEEYEKMRSNYSHNSIVDAADKYIDALKKEITKRQKEKIKMIKYKNIEIDKTDDLPVFIGSPGINIWDYIDYSLEYMEKNKIKEGMLKFNGWEYKIRKEDWIITSGKSDLREYILKGFSFWREKEVDRGIDNRVQKKS